MLFISCLIALKNKVGLEELLPESLGNPEEPVVARRTLSSANITQGKRLRGRGLGGSSSSGGGGAGGGGDAGSGGGVSGPSRGGGGGGGSRRSRSPPHKAWAEAARNRKKLGGREKVNGAKKGGCKCA